MEVRAELKDPITDIKELVKDITNIITDDKKAHLFVKACNVSRDTYEKPVKSRIWGWGYQFTRRRSEPVDAACSKIEKLPPADVRATTFLNLIAKGDWKSTSFNTGIFLNLLGIVQNDYNSLDFKTIHKVLIPRLVKLLKENLEVFIKNFEVQKKAEEKRELEKIANNTNNPVQKIPDLQTRAKELEANLGWLKQNVVLEKPQPKKNLKLGDYEMIADIFRNRPPIAPMPAPQKEVKTKILEKEVVLKTLEEKTLHQPEEKSESIVKPSTGKIINKVSVTDFEFLFAKRRVVTPPEIEVQPQKIEVQLQIEVQPEVEPNPAKTINKVNVADFARLFAARRPNNNSCNITASPTLL